MAAMKDPSEHSQSEQNQPTHNNNPPQISTDGGTYVGGNVSTGRDFVGRDQHIYQYFFNPSTLLKELTPWLKQYRWLLIALVGFELSFYLLFQQYKARFLLPLWVYLTGTLLLAVTILYWFKVIQSYSQQLKIKTPLTVASIATILYTGLIAQQAFTILYPATIPAEKFGIAIATFGEGPDFRLTRRGLQVSGLITAELKQTVAKLSEISESVALVPMGVVSNISQGEFDGNRIGADLVIWGQILEQEEGVVVNFRVLQAPGMLDNPAFPQVLPVTQRFVQSSIGIQSGDSITVKQITEQQSVAITAFSLGLYYQSIPDYKLAAEQFQLTVDYLETSQEATSVTDLGLALLYLGRSYVQLGRYDQALKMFNQATNYRPDDSALYVGLAYLYRVMGRKEDQQQALNRVIELGREYQITDNWLPALYNSGIAYEAQGNYEAALQQYQMILSKDPTFFSAYLSAGRVLIQLKRLDEARQLHQQAQPLAKENPAREIWLSLDIGRLYENQGEPDAAIVAYLQASTLAPELATPYFYLAELYAKQGIHDAAFINYQKFVNVSHDPAGAHASFAEFLYRINDYQAAIDHYLQALQYSSYDPALLYANLGRAYAVTNKKELAQAAFEKALSKPSESAAYIHSLYGNVLVRFNQLEDAIFHYEESLKLDNGIAFETTMNLAQQYEILNALDNAQMLYKSLLSAKDQLSNEQQQMIQERLQNLLEKSMTQVK